MAASKYRKIHTSFWSDTYIQEQEPMLKAFYIYLMTNNTTTQCGIYEITIRNMAFEFGLNENEIRSLLEKLIKDKKVKYNYKNCEVMILNWLKHNPIKGAPMIKCIDRELKSVKTKEFIGLYCNLCKQLGYPINSVYIDYLQEEEKEEEKEEENNILSAEADGVEPEQNNEGDKNTDEASKEGVEQPPEPEEPPKKLVPYKKVKELYNANCPTLPRVKELSDKRKRAIKSLFEKYGGIRAFEVVFKLVHQSDFLSGRSQKWTNCGFDWILKPDNFLKILEGYYGNKKPTTTQPTTRGWS